MTPQRAASPGNAAAAVRRWGWTNGAIDSRSQAMNEVSQPILGREIRLAVDTPASVRLPSMRPIDHRWDKSRGIVFHPRPRPTSDQTWTHGRGIVFSRETGARRDYAVRSLGSQPSTEHVGRPGSLVTNPNKMPGAGAASRGDSWDYAIQQIEELKDRCAKWEEDSRRMRLERDQAAEMANQKAEKQLQERTETLQKRAEEQKRKLDDALASTDERALVKAREEFEVAKNMLKADRDAIAADKEQLKADADALQRRQMIVMESERSVSAIVTAAEDRAREREARASIQLQELEPLKAQVATLQTIIENFELEHAHALLQDRQNTELQSATQVQLAKQAMLAREQQRSNYNDYRRIYSTLHEDMREYRSAIEPVKNTFTAISRVKQPSYTSRIEKLDPWATTKHEGLLKQLDGYAQGQRVHAERVGDAMRDTRLVQWDLFTAFGKTSHASRFLTRFHRMTENPSTMQTIDAARAMADERPFYSRRDKVEQEMKDLRRSIAREKNQTLASHYRMDLQELEIEHSVLSDSIMWHTRIREMEVVKAISSGPLADKEAFVVSLKSTSQIRQAASIRASVVGDAIHDGENNLSDDEQRKVRQDLADSFADVRDREGGLKERVQMRSLLEQNLGRVNNERVRELDKVIQGRLNMAKVSEKSALVSLALARRSGSRSFTRPGRPPVLIPRRQDAREAPRPARRAAPTPVSQTTLPADQSKSSSLPKIETQIAIEKKLAKVRTQLKRPEVLTNETAFQKAIAEQTEYRKKLVSALEQKLEAFKRRYGPHHKRVQALEKSCYEHYHALSRPPGLPYAARRRAKRLLRKMHPAPVSGEKSLEEPSTESKPGPLNIAPTAVLRAAHTFWPSPFHRMHSDEMSVAKHDCSDNMPEQLCSIEAVGAGSCSSSTESLQQQRDVEGSRPIPSPMPEHYSAPTSESNTQHDIKVNLHDTSELSNTSTSVSRTLRHAPATSITVHPARAQQNALDLRDQSQTASGDALAFQIPAAQYRSAVLASKSSSAAYWTYKLYKNNEGAEPSIRYCQKFAQAQEQASRLLHEPVVGFDIEWDPTAGFRKSRGIKDNVSLIQLAVDDKIALFHVSRFVGDAAEQLMPPALKEILESPNIVKAGVNVSGDARRLEKFLGIRMQGLFELSHLYRVVTYSESRPEQVSKKLSSLAEQVLQVLLLPLKKDDVRVSAWSKSLNAQQIEYSASDAYAGFKVFHALEAKRKGMKPMPPRPAYWELQMPLVLGDGTVLIKKSKKKVDAGAVAKDGGKGLADEEKDVGDDENEEFFDAEEQLEGQERAKAALGDDASASGKLEDIQYPTLPARNATDTTDPATLPSEPGAATGSSPALALANSWVATHRATGECSASALRLYHLWHIQQLPLRDIAALARDPPLATVTVASHVLEAVKTEKLEYDQERARECLDTLPGSVRGRYVRLA